MAFDLASISRNAGIKAPRLLVVGSSGVGKTTFAAGAPNPILIPCEDGLGALEVDHFPLAGSFEDVLGAVETLKSEDHEYQSVTLDTADWCESLIVAHVEQKYSAKDLAYGKDQQHVAECWRELLDGFNTLRNEKGMAVIILAHSQVKRFDSPEGHSYDRYLPKMGKASTSILTEWADAVLWANYDVKTRTVDGKGGERQVGITNGDRYLFTTETPAYLAKNRWGLPPKISLSWEAFATQLTK